jgi:putative methyltransferase (TIGR04325 family)
MPINKNMIPEKIKRIVKKVLPDYIIRPITGFFYGWSGNYSSWEEAKQLSSGYDSKIILEKVSVSAGKVRDGLAVYERDSVIYTEVEYSYPVLSGLLWIAAQYRGRLNVLDFGGSLGSSYYQNKMFLDSVEDLNWCIVEQPAFVEEGKKYFSNDRLHFFNTNDDCFNTFEIDVILLSSVLQYLEEPYKLLDIFLIKQVKYIIIDRTSFIDGNDRITIQKVHPAIYKASYPCWFLNKRNLIAYIEKSYELLLEFDALDKANIRSEFKGFIFRRK